MSAAALLQSVIKGKANLRRRARDCHFLYFYTEKSTSGRVRTRQLIYVSFHTSGKTASLQTYHKTDSILSQSRPCLAGWEWSGCRCQTTSHRRRRRNTWFSQTATCMGGRRGCVRNEWRTVQNKEKLDQSGDQRGGKRHEHVRAGNHAAKWTVKYETESTHYTPRAHMDESHRPVFRMAPLVWAFASTWRCYDCGVPVVETGRYGHGVEGHSQAQVAHGQVDDKVLGRLQQVLFLVGDVEQRAVPKHWTHAWKNHTKPWRWDGSTLMVLHRQIQRSEYSNEEGKPRPLPIPKKKSIKLEYWVNELTKQWFI